MIDVKLKLMVVSMVVMMFLGAGAGILFPGEPHEGERSTLRTFSSFSELQDFLNKEPDYQRSYGSYLYSPGKIVTMEGATLDNSAPSTSPSGEHSDTNLQVEGVDEGDIVKNDGRFAYIVSANKTEVFIVLVYPAEEARILSVIKLNWSIREIYLYEDRLVILGRYSYYYTPYENACLAYSPGIYVMVYDIKDKEHPQLKREKCFEGGYITSRMIGKYLYVIVNQPVWGIESEDDLPVPPHEIYHVEEHDHSYTFTSIVSINVENDEEEINKIVILLGTSNNIYVSTSNIYITYKKMSYDHSQLYFASVINTAKYPTYSEKTVIHRISINDGISEYKASGEVQGRVLNRFSMDEYKRHFRIATTTGHVLRSGDSSAKNQVYVLDMDLNMVGSIENIAPGERIYSARFMGKRAYLVTFKKVDPFFVLDLSNPRHPKILGELKIPGYSNYLHPYDENHVIGIGKDTVDMGDFAWYQGVKLSLFDVSDVKNPKELAKFIIGDRGTESNALRDPHAFLFDLKRNLLVIPITLYTINESKYPDGAPPHTHGEYTWNGVYVFRISAENGIGLKGRISHEDRMNSDNYYQRYYSNAIPRSFYIEDTLYTVSSRYIKAHNLDDLNEINSVELGY
ncbi:MAG: beta-propeller domain-containing protein [Thermoplasmata archaeon]|nr:MAG: beta-propeller domain-containing protein [Thermoplasmata archaeon]